MGGRENMKIDYEALRKDFEDGMDVIEISAKHGLPGEKIMYMAKRRSWSRRKNGVLDCLCTNRSCDAGCAGCGFNGEEHKRRKALIKAGKFVKKENGTAALVVQP